MLPLFPGYWQETRDYWVRDKKMIYLSQKTVARESVFALVPQAPIPTGWYKRTRTHFHKHWAVSKERNPELKEHRAFIMSSSLYDIFPRARYYFYFTEQQTNFPLPWSSKFSVFQDSSLYKHSWKGSLEQRQTVPRLRRHTGTQKTHGEFSPKTDMIYWETEPPYSKFMSSWRKTTWKG